ncbi:SGNH/GDSL hydrolase family protein [Arthrobacter sp. Sr24]
MTGGKLLRGVRQRAVVLLVVSTVLLGLGPGDVVPTAKSERVAPSDSVPVEVAAFPPLPVNYPERNTVPDGGRASAAAVTAKATTVWDLPPGSLVLNPASGRREVINPEVWRTAVLIGDSQSSGAAGVTSAQTWVVHGLAERGYTVDFVGGGGTGFTAASERRGNYPDALDSGQMLLPYGDPALVVIQGGGNDAARGASDAQILANADRLLRQLKASYPQAEFLLIGTLARGGRDGGRRTQVDTLLAGFAKSNGVPFISTGDWITRYGVGNKMTDGVHLTASGHSALSRVLADRLKTMKLQGPVEG